MSESLWKNQKVATNARMRAKRLIKYSWDRASSSLGGDCRSYLTVSTMSQSYAKSRSSHQDSIQKIWLKEVAGWIDQNNKEVTFLPPNLIKTSRTPSETKPVMSCPAKGAEQLASNPRLWSGILSYHRSSPSHIYDRVTQSNTGAKVSRMKDPKALCA